MPLTYYVLVLNVKGNICLQCEDTEALFHTGRAEAGSSCLFFLSRGKHFSSTVHGLFWLSFFCTNTENCFNAGN